MEGDSAWLIPSTCTTPAKAYAEALGTPLPAPQSGASRQAGRDVVVTDGIRYRMYSPQSALAPVAYANLARLKKSAAHLFARMKRP